MNDTPEDPDSGDGAIPARGRDVPPPERTLIRHPSGSRINVGRIVTGSLGAALILDPPCWSPLFL
jgi:hypothetical protein